MIYITDQTDRLHAEDRLQVLGDGSLQVEEAVEVGEAEDVEDQIFFEAVE